MRNLIIVFLLTLLFYSCGNSYDASESAEEQAKADYYSKLNEVKEFQKKFEFGKWCFNQQMYDQARKNFKEVIQNRNNYKDSIINFYNQNIDMLLQNDKANVIETAEEFGFANNTKVFYLKENLQLTKEDSIRNAQMNVIKDRKWVFFGEYNGFDKNHIEDDNYLPCYYDENHLLYEGDTVCVMIKKCGTYYYSDHCSYQYISLNLKSKVVHGIDESSHTGISYNYIWDGDWWKENSQFADDLLRHIGR